MNVMELPAWAVEHWQITVALVVLLAAPLLVVRAWRRAESRLAARRTLSDEEQAAWKEAAERRGRRIEDTLTLVVASAAAYLSSTGLRQMGREVMGLQDPWDWLPFVSLDIAAIVCGLRARRRAARGDGPGLSGVLVWILVGISSAFSAGEADTWHGTVARAVWPLIAGILFELGSLEERRTAKEREKRRAGKWLDRKLDAVRLLHPIEWVRVQMALAADETLSQAEATRQVRIDRAGYRLYRLRQLHEANKERLFRWAGGALLVMRADRRAQVAQAKVATGDLPLMLEAVQRRVRTRDLATLSYTSPAGAERALASLIGTRTARTGTGAGMAPVLGSGTGIEALPAGTRTTLPPGTGHPGTGTGGRDTGRAGADTGAGTGQADGTPVPGTDTGTGSDTGTATGGVPEGTAQAGAGTHPGAGTDHGAGRDGAGTDDGPSDEELIERLRRALRENGTFATGGIKRTGRTLGIGTDRARRLMDTARSLGPLPASGIDEVRPHPDPDQEPEPAPVPPTEAEDPVGEAGPESQQPRVVDEPRIVLDFDAARPVTELLGGEPVLAGPATPSGR